MSINLVPVSSLLNIKAEIQCTFKVISLFLSYGRQFPVNPPAWSSSLVCSSSLCVQLICPHMRSSDQSANKTIGFQVHFESLTYL